MGKPTGFIEYPRQDYTQTSIAERLTHYNEFTIPLSIPNTITQAARCMDCGIPYCHQACPVHNLIPDFNDLIYRDDWRTANEILHLTNNFPEITGRICPAPCEAACTLNINSQPVAIKTVERAIADNAWKQGWITPQVPARRTGKRIAIIGSGPAGLAAAQQLARAGHHVTIFEKQDHVGGLLRYGIPDFKLSKTLIDRRMSQMRTEGVDFHTHTHVGIDLSIAQLRANYHAIILTGGAEHPRDLAVPGREFSGIYLALDFLRATSKRVQGIHVAEQDFVSAEGKTVLVIGGGDTGSDCVGTANRHNAKAVIQIELLPRPPEQENTALTWPSWPNRLRTTSSHEEGCQRLWSINTLAFHGDNHGHVCAAQCIKVEWQQTAPGQWHMQEIPGTQFTIPCDMVTVAMGFQHTTHLGLVVELQATAGLILDARGNVQSLTSGPNAYSTSVEGIFTAGDMRRGQSLVVWAITEGRECARAVDQWLMGKTDLPR